MAGLGSGVAAAVRNARATATEVGRAGRYVARTFGAPAGLRGLALEGAWLAAHAAVYPAGLLHEQLVENTGFRTDPLTPAQRSLVVTDLEAAGTPILLVHGIMDNRSVFTVFRRNLRRRGFGTVHTMNYSLLTGDIRTAAHEQLRDVGHLSLPIDSRAMRWVVDRLARSETERHPFRRGHRDGLDLRPVFDHRSSPAS